LEQGDLAGARRAFERAYEASPHFVVLYNLGRVCAELGDLEGAIQHLQRYLAEGAERIEESKRVAASALLLELESRSRTKAVGATETLTGHGAEAADASAEPPDPHRPPPLVTLTPKGVSRPPGTKVRREMQSVFERTRNSQQSYALGLGSGGLVVLAGSAALAIWNAGRYVDWQASHAGVLRDKPAPALVTQEQLSRVAAYERARGQADAELRSIRHVDAVTWVGVGLGTALVGVGVLLYVTAPPSVRARANGRHIDVALRF
jgi:hypothetical protein